MLCMICVFVMVFNVSVLYMSLLQIVLRLKGGVALVQASSCDERVSFITDSDKQ